MEKNNTAMIKNKLFIITFADYYSYGTRLEYTLYSPDDITVTLTLTITVKPLSPNLTHDFAQDLSFGNERALKNQEAKTYTDNNGVQKSTATYYDVELAQVSNNLDVNIPILLGDKKIQQGNNFGVAMTVQGLNENNLMIENGFIKFDSLYSTKNKIEGDSILVFQVDYFDGLATKYSVIGFVRVFKRVLQTEVFKDVSNGGRDDINLTNPTMDISNIKPIDEKLSSYTISATWATVNENILTVSAGYIGDTVQEYKTKTVLQKYKGSTVMTVLDNDIKFNRRFITNEQQFRAIDGSNGDWYISNNFAMGVVTNSFIQDFSGRLYGNGHTISNLKIIIPSDKFGSSMSYGLIGTLSGTVQDLTNRQI